MFEISKQNFEREIEKLEYPAILPLMARIKTNLSPLEVYINIASKSYSYLLESAEKEKRHARFSFIGSDPDAVIATKQRKISIEICNRELYDLILNGLKQVSKEVQPEGDKITAELKEEYDTFDALRSTFNIAKFQGENIFKRQAFLGGLIGYFAYDLVYDCWLKIKNKKQASTPDAIFLLTTQTVVFDHLSNEVFIVETPVVQSKQEANKSYAMAKERAKELLKSLATSNSSNIQSSRIKPSFKCNLEKEEFEKMVEKAKQYIYDGDIFQVVLSRRYEAEVNLTPLEIYRALRRINPSPYMYLLKFKELAIIGTSPETLLSIFNRRVVNNPIAGTCARGKTPEEDEELAKQMLNDKKEIAEHVMLVDLGRNDVRMVSKPGSVKVINFMSVLKYSHVQHIESTIIGELRDECDAFDATRAIMPMGTVSGAPKIRAMEIIHELEKDARGIYAGGVGYYAWDGSADFAITIRTIVVNNGIASVQAGAGIVADSIPEREFYETERKMRAMLKAMEGEE